MTRRGPDRTSSAVPYLLFLLAGLLLGYALAHLTVPGDPDVGQAIATAVIGVAILIVGVASRPTPAETPRTPDDADGR